jgi:hypothetical protein
MESGRCSERGLCASRPPGARKLSALRAGSNLHF